MTQDQITISTQDGEASILASYSDDDIVIIDNIKMLAEPSSARLKMNMLAVCSRGKAHFDLNGVSIAVGERQLLMAAPNAAFTNFLFSPDFEFKVIFLTNRILLSFLREKMSIWNEMLYVHKMHVVTMEPEDIEYFMHFYHMIRLCYESEPTRLFRTEVVQSVLRSGILGLCGRLKGMLAGTPQQEMLRSSALFQRFIDTLSRQAVKHRPVSAFADELCVTPKYLSMVCKKCSGKTAGQWITEQVMEDIRYNLSETDLSIKEVCNILGFNNASFFGKYVREHFGMTPQQLRQHLRHK